MTLALALAFLLAGAPALAAQNEHVIYRFKGGSDGSSPATRLIQDDAGNLYGTTTYGGGGKCEFSGSAGCGVVFELSPSSTKDGAWTESVLYRFAGYRDGAFPEEFVRFDREGNIIGATGWGVAGNCSVYGFTGCGTVFKLTRPASAGGIWTKSVLYNFLNGADGFVPASLILSNDGDLFGVTHYGGSFSNCMVGCGTAFVLKPSGKGGTWSKTVLYKFRGMLADHKRGDGERPIGLLLDPLGNLLGSTQLGGECSGPEGGTCNGTVFELTHAQPSADRWTEKVLYRFTGDDKIAESTVALDASGELYGTTDVEAFRLSSGRREVLHIFTGSPDGKMPNADLSLDSAGNVYGTTTGGGAPRGQGMVFRLTRPAKAGTWQETRLHEFTGSPDGDAPAGPVIVGKDGGLYGTTMQGGTSGCKILSFVGCGTVFRIEP